MVVSIHIQKHIQWTNLKKKKVTNTEGGQEGDNTIQSGSISNGAKGCKLVYSFSAIMRQWTSVSSKVSNEENAKKK
jgi:hypothetical protein